MPRVDSPNLERRFISTQRNEMKQNLYLLGLFTVSGAMFFAHPTSAQTDEIRERVNRRILISCTATIPSTPDRAAALVLGTDAVPYIIEAFNNGPPEVQVAAVEVSARRRLESIRGMMDAGATFGLAPADLQRLRDISLEDYVGNAVSDFVFAFGGAALGVASEVGGPDLEGLLRRVADDETSIHAATAAELLGRGGI
jgi:hypothetical protein